MTVTVYVKGKTEHGYTWLENPRPWSNGGLSLAFDRLHALAGIHLKRGEKTFVKRLTDELDKAKVPWANLRNPCSCVLTIDKKDVQLFMMELDLTGPLPMEVAAGISCDHRRKSLGLRRSVRYGG